MSSLLNKGNFEKMDASFIDASLEVFEALSKIQDKFKKGDTDTIINEVRDSIAARFLNFTHINTEKHGFDARRTLANDKAEFLEVKSASFDAKTWGATFNDTNQDKADAFKRDDVYLCLSLWKNASEPVFFAYGQNSGVGKFLEDKMINRPAGTRSTQSISLQNLVNEYGFNIYSVSKTPHEIYTILQNKSGCKGIPLTAIRMIGELPKYPN